MECVFRYFTEHTKMISTNSLHHVLLFTLIVTYY